MRKFELRQRLEVTNPDSLFEGKTGIVTELSDISNEVQVLISGEGTKWFRPHELKHVTPDKPHMEQVVRSIEASGMTIAQLNVFLKMAITGRVTVQHMIELGLAGISTADYNKAVLRRAKDTP